MCCSSIRGARPSGVEVRRLKRALIVLVRQISGNGTVSQTSVLMVSINLSFRQMLILDKLCLARDWSWT
jgi:hypothetical protein